MNVWLTGKPSKKRTYAQKQERERKQERDEARAEAEEQRAQVKVLRSEISELTESNSLLVKRATKLEERLEQKQETLDTQQDKRHVAEKACRVAHKENTSLQREVLSAAERANLAAQEAAEATQQVAAQAAQMEQMDVELTELRVWQKERTPAKLRKPAGQHGKRRSQQRASDARARLTLALQDADLRVKDISAVLEAEGKLDLMFETKELWERKMTFASSICETLQAAWSVDLSVDFHSEFLISQRDMDGMRFTLSHEIINGRPRPRVLISNPYAPRQSKLNFPQPLRSRSEWVVREKEREAALNLITTQGVETCERDFDATLDALVARDEALIAPERADGRAEDAEGKQDGRGQEAVRQDHRRLR